MQFKWIAVLSLAVGSLAALEQTENVNDKNPYTVYVCASDGSVLTKEACQEGTHGGEICSKGCVMRIEDKRRFNEICSQLDGRTSGIKDAPSRSAARAAAGC
ncbi:hypothetical protein N7452_011367 [Penicillium brevicompactum]|uniref:Uncharacterized protein n=1 Tax=Penicillium brevicompactum TaxID=5074 RepID=A0A9W9Q3X3_PENBR|nr:hypothetical protein N7452_011367 [Penicillium brevicompactum]